MANVVASKRLLVSLNKFYSRTNLLRSFTQTTASNQRCLAIIPANVVMSKSIIHQRKLATVLLNPRVFVCRSFSQDKNEAKKQQDAITSDTSDPIPEDEKNLGLVAKFKLMYKKYWYVLIPVHLVTSIGWLGGFYYLSKSGVDISALLQTLHFSESVVKKLENSEMGHLAIAYFCYKIATPARYMVTLGGTTASIKYLVNFGYIKPMPTKNELKQLYTEKKAERAKRKEEKAKEKESSK